MEYESLTESLRKLAMKVAPDYPNVDVIEPYELIYAIEATFDGITAANNDLHKMIRSNP